MMRGPAIGLVRGLDIDGADHLLAQHLSAAVARFGSVALGVIDLPPIAQAAPSKAELQVAAVIAWAREVEATELLAVVDAIARGVATGMLNFAVDDVTSRRLIEHYRRRDERFGADERRALFDRVLGGIEADLANLVAALSEIGRAGATQSTLHLETRAAIAGMAVASALSERASGIAAYAARDITAQVRDALDLLGTPSVAQALGGGGVWAIVRRFATQPVDIERATMRATAIRTIITWLADHAASLPEGRISIARTDAVVSAALTWSSEGA